MTSDGIIEGLNVFKYNSISMIEILELKAIQPPIGMTGKLALPTLIALCSIALGKLNLSSLAVLGEISTSGTLIKVDELPYALQVCLDSGAKRLLLPSTSFVDFATVPPDLMSAF
jgi:ATP-dependent Lon protease